jgi:hypothetical protein
LRKIQGAKESRFCSNIPKRRLRERELKEFLAVTTLLWSFTFNADSGSQEDLQAWLSSQLRQAKEYEGTNHLKNKDGDVVEANPKVNRSPRSRPKPKIGQESTAELKVERKARPQ